MLFGLFALFLSVSSNSFSYLNTQTHTHSEEVACMSASPGLADPFPSQRVVVLRHGERRDNHPDAPAESNPPLTSEGVAAVEGTAARLKRYLGEAEACAAVLIVSPFLRTLQTAESLQFYGVGSEHAMVVDNTLCEVFGPSRIKTGHAPQLPTHPTLGAVGGLPVWGESLETATERYVASFLRNGDVYGGQLARGGTVATGSNSDTSFIGREDSNTSSSLMYPPAVTKRTNGATAALRGSGNGAAPAALNTHNSSDNVVLSNMKSGKPCDVILVTHGDAISAVLSHFYPARVVYEADFLSFIIMRRYGAGNCVYHLDESAGVSWFVEGIDREPQDPILYALELDRDAAARKAGKGGTATTNDNIQTNAATDDEADNIDYDDDDEGEALDDDDDEFIHMASFAGSRMKPRTSRLPARRNLSPTPPPPRVAASTGEVASTTSSALPPTQAQLRLGANARTQVPASHHRRGTSAGNGTVSYPCVVHANGGGGGSASESSMRHHPKGGEGCERIRLPGGTPAQSSSNPVSTTADDDGMHHRRGHSRSSSDNDNEKAARGSGAAEKSRPGRDRVEKKEESEEREEEKESRQQGGSRGPTHSIPSKIEEGASNTSLRCTDIEQMGTLLRDMSSYGGLTADSSASSQLKSEANSIHYFCALAAREKTVSVDVAPPTVPAKSSASSLPPAASPSITSAALSTATVIPVSSTATAATSANKRTLTTRALSRNGSAAVPPAVQPAKGSGVAYGTYGATPVPHDETTSVDGSATSVQPIRGIAPVAPSEVQDGSSYHATTVPNLVRRVHLYKALARATNVSLLMRVVCLLLLVVVAIALHAHAALAWYCVLAVLWEIALAVVLALSCRAKRTSLTAMVVVRRAVEQLRFQQLYTPLSSSSSAPATTTTRSSNLNGLIVGVPPTTAGRDGESGSTSFLQFQDPRTFESHYESSTVWQQVGQHAEGDVDDASGGGSLTQPRSRSAVVTVLLCARHVAATAAKLFALYLLSFLGALMSEGHAGRAWHSVGQLYSTPTGLVLTLLYGCANVIRGTWDETRIDAVLDQC